MSRSQLSLAVLLVVALVVALEEWRIAGWRGRANKAEQELELAMAELPPPPRPEDKGAANSVIGATRIRRIKDRNEERMVAEEAAGATVEPALVVDPTEAVATVMNDQPLAETVDYTESVNQMYAALIDSFGLNETERAYFIDLLVDGMKFQELLAAARATATTDEGRASADQKMADAERDFGAKIRHFLGNDRDFAVYQAYVTKLSEQLGGQ